MILRGYEVGPGSGLESGFPLASGFVVPAGARLRATGGSRAGGGARQSAIASAPLHVCLRSWLPVRIPRPVVGVRRQRVAGVRGRHAAGDVSLGVGVGGERRRRIVSHPTHGHARQRVDALPCPSQNTIAISTLPPGNNYIEGCWHLYQAGEGPLSEFPGTIGEGGGGGWQGDRLRLQGRNIHLGCWRPCRSGLALSAR